MPSTPTPFLSFPPRYPRPLPIEGARRYFRVVETVRITSSYRPSFQFSGCIVEERGGGGAGPASETTIESNLTLSLQYEPPSPKFTRQCPDR